MKLKSDSSPKKKPDLKSSATRSQISRGKIWNDRRWIYAILLTVTLIYARIFSNHFTNWDDNFYILTNPYLKLDLTTILEIFTHNYMGNYHPVTMLFYSIAHSFGGTNPWIYHLFNLSLHLGNTFLVFTFINLLLRNDQKNPHAVAISLITSLLFGIHTLQSESVVWMSELKTLLYAFFFLLSLIYYVKYTESAKIKHYCIPSF